MYPDDIDTMVNSVDPVQTALSGTVRSRSKLFIQIFLLKTLDQYNTLINKQNKYCLFAYKIMAMNNVIKKLYYIIELCHKKQVGLKPTCSATEAS